MNRRIAIDRSGGGCGIMTNRLQSDDRSLDPAEGVDEEVREVLRAERGVVGEIDCVRRRAHLLEMGGDAIPA